MSISKHIPKLSTSSYLCFPMTDGVSVISIMLLRGMYIYLMLNDMIYIVNQNYVRLRVCLVVVFKNCYGKHILRIVFCVCEKKNKKNCV